MVSAPAVWMTVFRRPHALLPLFTNAFRPSHALPWTGWWRCCSQVPIRCATFVSRTYWSAAQKLLLFVLALRARTAGMVPANVDRPDICLALTYDGGSCWLPALPTACRCGKTFCSVLVNVDNAQRLLLFTVPPPCLRTTEDYACCLFIWTCCCRCCFYAPVACY